METTVSLKGLGITTDSIMDLYADLINNNPEFFYLEQTIIYYYQGNKITSAELSYTMSESEQKTASAAYEEELTHIISLCDTLTSEADMALFVHDYFVENFEYDTEHSVFDAYGLFTEGRGVCQAYALGAAAVLKELGMEVLLVSSDAMNHAWNLIRVDGEWYHADFSRDDPVDSRPGCVSHNYFLLSDKAIAATHYGFDSAVKCTSVLYDNDPIKNVRSPIVFAENGTFRIDESAEALVYQPKTEAAKTVFSFDENWFVAGSGGSSYWSGVFSGLVSAGEQILFNTPSHVMAYFPLENRMETVFENTDSSLLIYGIEKKGDNLSVYLADHPDTPTTTKILALPLKNALLPPEPAPLPFKDVSPLSRYYDAIRFTYNAGIFKGISDDTFSPDESLTRGMFVTILGRLCGMDPDQYPTSSFSDVPENQWYTAYVAWAAENGIVNGFGDGTFSPDTPVTREQMYHIIRRCGEKLNVLHPASQHSLPFRDRDSISDWAEESVAGCFAAGLIEEVFYTDLKPQKEASRSEAAWLMFRFSDLLS